MSWEVIVVGVGAIGAGTCAALAKRGVRVLGIDGASVPNDRSSHHGDSRVFRVAYAEHPDYVELLKLAAREWLALGETTGTRLLHQCGVLYVGAPGCDIIGSTAMAAEMHGVEHERLSMSEVNERFPQFVAPPDYEGLFEPGGGWVEAELGVRALADEAVRRGAEIRPNEPVLGWAVAGDGVVVRTAAGEHRASRLVLTAGAWTAGLLQDLDVPLRVSRQALCWTEPDDVALHREGAFPVWAIETPDGLGYGFPVREGQRSVKSAIHLPGPTCDPAAERESPTDEEIAAVRRVLARHLPRSNGRLDRAAACFYTNTPDGHFIIDRHPAHERVVLGAGLSGHGFKFAPVLGRALADLALDGKTDVPVGFLSLSRFDGQGA